MSREKNVDKIQMFGPYAAALSFIIHCGNINQSEFKRDILVYRGLKLTVDELSQKYSEGRSIKLKGFTSTSIDRDRALKFALQDVDKKSEVNQK